MIRNRELAQYAMQKVASAYLYKLAADDEQKKDEPKKTMGQRTGETVDGFIQWGKNKYDKSKAALLDFYKKHGEVINRVGTDAAAFGGGSILGLILNRVMGNKSTASKWISSMGGGTLAAGAVEGARYLDDYLDKLHDKAKGTKA
jgi:hypothetical protein